MKILLTIFQELLKISLFFTICYIWLNYSLYDKSLVLILSVIFSLIFEVTTFLIYKNHSANKALKTTQSVNAEKSFLSLVIDKNALTFFYNLFASRHKKVVQENEFISIYDQENNLSIFYPFLKIKPLDIDDILFISKKSHAAKKIIIFCNEYTPSCIQFKQQLSQEIVLLNKYEAYSMLYKEYDFFPEIKKSIPSDRTLSPTKLKAVLFSQNKIKNYILCGLVLFISSIYVPYSLYYKIFASILLLLALISLFMHKSKKTSMHLL